MGDILALTVIGICVFWCAREYLGDRIESVFPGRTSEICVLITAAVLVLARGFSHSIRPR